MSEVLRGISLQYPYEASHCFHALGNHLGAQVEASRSEASTWVAGALAGDEGLERLAPFETPVLNLVVGKVSP